MSAKKKSIKEQKDGQSNIPVHLEDLTLLAHQTRHLLAFHQEIGITGYPVCSGMADFFVDKKPVVSGSVDALARTMKAGGDGARRVSEKSAARELERLVHECSDCNNCGFDSAVVVPGLGSLTPRLFVVGDYYEGDVADKGIFGGREEDALFWKMMAAIGLDQSSVYVTNCIKCSSNAAPESVSERARRCFPYLERELMILQPEIICIMGELTAQVLLKSRQPLLRTRGRLHSYQYARGIRARVMPTFHPRFLLQYPEMKRAVWLDLQAVQRLL